MVNRFAVYSPILGVRQDYPWILLSKAVTKDNTAVQIWNGELRKQKMRTKELVRDYYGISSIDTSGNTISITGNYVAQFPSGASITIYDSDDNYETITLNTTGEYNSTSTVLTATTSIALADAEYVFNNEHVGSNDPASIDFLKVGFLDGNCALRYETLRLSYGTERLIGFTKAHIYYWNSALTRWDELFECSSDCTYWDADQYGDHLVATNNIDRPLQWDGNSANVFEPIDTQYTATTSDYISKAQFIGEYQNYLLLGNVELSNGTRYQEHIYFSNVGQGVITDGFRQDMGGDAGAVRITGSGDISGGFGKWQGYLIIFKRKSIRKLWNTGDTIPFQQSELLDDIGCVAPGSVGKDWEGNLYYYGTDKSFREITTGIISDGINKTARDVNPEHVGLIRFLAVDEYNELRWAIPYGNSATANNKIVVYKPKERRWDTDIDIAVTAFGSYTRQFSLTWNTLPFSTWDSWGWDSWDSVESATDFYIDICSDDNGYTYALHGGYFDDGQEYESSFEITTDLTDKKTLPLFKRILHMYVYVQKESTGTLTLSVKRDNENSFQSVGSINLTGEETILRQHVPCNIRGRHFLFKVSGTSEFRFIGVEMEFVTAGYR